MARPRTTHRPRDMIISLGVILVPILLVSWFFSRPAQPPVQRVDWEPVAARARAEASYDVLAPRLLPAEWTPVRATWDQASGTWTGGWLTPGRVYVSVNQRATAPDAFIAAVARDARREGDRAIGNSAWEQYRSDDDRTRALARRSPGVVTVVTGDLSYEDLASFVATLA